MTFEEFLIYVRKHINKKVSDDYIRCEYNRFEFKTLDYILQEMPYLAIRAKAITYYGR